MSRQGESWRQEPLLFDSNQHENLRSTPVQRHHFVPVHCHHLLSDLLPAKSRELHNIHSNPVQSRVEHEKFHRPKPHFQHRSLPPS